jgi:hypothetical protein
LTSGSPAIDALVTVEPDEGDLRHGHVYLWDVNRIERRNNGLCGSVSVHVSDADVRLETFGLAVHTVGSEHCRDGVPEVVADRQQGAGWRRVDGYGFGANDGRAEVEHERRLVGESSFRLVADGSRFIVGYLVGEPDSLSGQMEPLQGDDVEIPDAAKGFLIRRDVCAKRRGFGEREVPRVETAAYSPAWAPPPVVADVGGVGMWCVGVGSHGGSRVDQISDSDLSGSASPGVVTWTDRTGVRYSELCGKHHEAVKLLADSSAVGLRFHDLRHFYATELVSNGVPLNDVSALLGHAQISTTANRYTHASQERHARAVKAFADFSLTPDPSEGPDDEDGRYAVAV